MTGSRHNRSAWLFWAGSALALASLLIVAGPKPGGAATTQRIVTDYRSGLAISGFDPVAYFTDGAALIGSEEFEHVSDGVVWRFRNEGNLAAFAANAAVYRPQFGGYDPVAAARGVAVPGHPQMWIVKAQRLYLFFDSAARQKFISESDDVLVAAQARWREVESSLAQ
jgi:hypothetical protein